jgi:hypothetical protein
MQGSSGLVIRTSITPRAHSDVDVTVLNGVVLDYLVDLISGSEDRGQRSISLCLFFVGGSRMVTFIFAATRGHSLRAKYDMPLFLTMQIFMPSLSQLVMEAVPLHCTSPRIPFIFVGGTGLAHTKRCTSGSSVFA